MLYVSGPSIGQGSIDSARQNLAASFVSGLVNAAFCKDKLLTEDGNAWLYKNKEHGEYNFCCCYFVDVPVSQFPKTSYHFLHFSFPFAV